MGFPGGPQPLSWATRIKVAIGAARGLSFLHDAEEQVIYRDFKASNILLDGVWTKLLTFKPQYLLCFYPHSQFHIGYRNSMQNCRILVWPKLAQLVIGHTYLLKLWVHMAMLHQNTSPQVSHYLKTHVTKTYMPPSNYFLKEKYDPNTAFSFLLHIISS